MRLSGFAGDSERATYAHFILRVQTLQVSVAQTSKAGVACCSVPCVDADSYKPSCISVRTLIRIGPHASASVLGIKHSPAPARGCAMSSEGVLGHTIVN